MSLSVAQLRAGLSVTWNDLWKVVSDRVIHKEESSTYPKSPLREKRGVKNRKSKIGHTVDPYDSPQCMGTCVFKENFRMSLTHRRSDPGY